MTANVKLHLQFIKSETQFPWFYVLLAYGWTWLWTIPVALTKQDYRTSTFQFLATFIAVFGPGLTALMLTYRLDDQQARRDYLRRVFDLGRLKLSWIVVVLLRQHSRGHSSCTGSCHAGNNHPCTNTG